MKKKNILLIRTTNAEGTIPPLGLLYIASAIRNKNEFKEYNLKIIDFNYEELDDNGFTKKILDFLPDLILLSSLDSEYALFKKLCTLARQTAPKSLLIAGGILASNYHNEIISNKLVDYVVRGEGELTIVELLDAINNNKKLPLVKGITYRENEKVIATPQREFIQDLDAIPFPAWDLIDLKGYSKIPNWNGILFGKYYAPIMTSRGCVFNCIYCHNLFGKKIRTRSVENVLSEMKMLYKDYDIREFHIIDDFFNFDLKRVINICKGIIKNKMKIKISFPNGLRADRMDKETLIWLRKAGTYKINYAIETASPRIQKLIKKNLNLEKATHYINETSKLGIITFGFFMFGFPTETVDEMEKTISFAVHSKLDTAKFFKVIAFKNTQLENYTSKKLLSYQQSLQFVNTTAFYDEIINFSDIPTETLNSIIVNAHQQFYFKLGRVLRIIIKYRKFEAIKRLCAVYSYVLAKKRENKEPQVIY